ncbi:MAG: DUF2589 domain-containing protein [Bacteroidota bacterium]
MPTIQNQPLIPDFTKELDIESIISAPLVAVSKANAVMVSGQTQFLLEYCFTKTADNNYQPVLIEMQLTRGIADETKQPGDPDYIRQETMTFTVPLLCIVPMNSLAVDKVTIGFDLEVTSAVNQPSQPTNGSSKSVLDNKAQLNGKVTYSPQPNTTQPGNNRQRSQLSSKINVNLSAANLPLPNGVLTIIDLYTKGIQPAPSKNNTPAV